MPYKNPEERRRYQREYYRKKRGGSDEKKVYEKNLSTLTLDLTIDAIKQPDGLVTLLSEQIMIVRSLKCDPIVKARAIATLANTSLKIYESSEITRRLDEIESMLHDSEK